MSERSLRAQNLIDYKAPESVRTYGQRIYKGPRVVSNTPKLNMTQNQGSGKKIARKLNGLKKMYWSIFFFDVDESQVPIDYFALQRELGDDGRG